MNKYAWCMLVCGAMLMTSCSKEPVAGGGATETGNGLQIQVVTAEGLVAKGAQVKFVKTDSWVSDVSKLGSPIVVSVMADSNGRVFLDSLTPGNWSKQVECNGQMAIAPIEATDSNSIIILQHPGQIRVHLDSSQVSQLRIVGSAWIAQVDSSGYYTLSLPPGQFAIASVVGKDLQMAAETKIVAGSLVDTMVAVRKGKVVVDDFSSGDMFTTLSRYTGMGNWYKWAPTGTTVSVSWNNQLNLQYSSDSSFYQAIVGISFVTGTAYVYHELDLTDMDSLCFDAMGDGTMSIALQKMNDTLIVANSAATADDTLTSNWTHRCYTPASFGTKWDTIKTIANNWSFIAKAGSQVSLRNLELWGVSLQNLSP